MGSISFDNPYLLFLGIPLLAAVIIPFCFAVRKENRSVNNIVSLVLHTLIVVLVTLVVSGMTYRNTTTETNVYVLADVSYSSHGNLEVIDGYIDEVRKSLPENSQMSVIAFGRNVEVVSQMGEDVKSVKSAENVDTSATDISNALRYAGNLFDDDVIKRIVVITDGEQTSGNSRLASVVNSLKDDGVYIDAVFVNNNLPDGVNEIQVTSVEHTSASFLDKDESAEIVVSCNNADPTNVYIDTDRDGVVTSRTETLYKGQNYIAVPLDTSTVGTFRYKVSVRAVNADADSSQYNNSCVFEQTVTDSVDVLFIGGSASDVVAGRKIYGDKDVVYVTDPKDVPYTVEALCAYDEIVLSNFDVRTLTASEQFVSSLDTVVSTFGKTLMTYGNTFVQESSEEKNTALETLGGMMPVKVGNPDQDSRLVAIVLDISSSTNFAGRLEVARAAAATLVNNLNSNDTVMIVGYSGDLKILYPASYLTKKSVAIDAINSYEPRNGTLLAPAMEYAYREIMSRGFHHREVIIVSDGLNSDSHATCLSLAQNMSKDNIVISALGIYPGGAANDEFLRSLVENVNANGKGYYKPIAKPSDVDYIFADLGEQLNEVRIEGGSYEITVRRAWEQVVSNVTALPDIGGFWYNSKKTDAVAVVMTAKWYRDRITSFDVPIYAYWQFGNGKAVSFMSDISVASSWTSGWTGESEKAFFGNVKSATLPDEEVKTPFVFETESIGNSTRLYVTASQRSFANVTARVEAPNGSVVSKPLTFDSKRYVADFTTEAVGVYKIHLDYEYASQSYTADGTFSIPYYAEYDSFTRFAVASLYKIVGDNGEISFDGRLAMDNSNSEIRMYSLSFTVPFMIVAVLLFVADVVIRKMK